MNSGLTEDKNMHKEDKTLCLRRFVTVISEKCMRNGAASAAFIKCPVSLSPQMSEYRCVCVNINSHSSAKSADTANVHRSQKIKSASLSLE